MAELERVHRALDLPGWSAAEPRFRTYLDSIQGYRKNSHRHPPDEIARVERHWEPSDPALGLCAAGRDLSERFRWPAV